MATYSFTGVVDPVTGKPYKPPGATAWADDTWDLGYSPDDIRRKQNQGVKEAGIAAGIGAAGELAQLGLSFIDTPQDKYNKERLAELESSRKGLSADERRVAEDTMMNPVRAMASEQRERAEGSLAAMGGASAADLARVRRESDRRVAEAGVQAGGQIAKLDLDAAAEQRAEEERRRAYESERANARIERIGQTLAGLATTAGPALASLATESAMTNADLKAMQDARNADGTPTYPGYQGLTLNEIRQAIRAEEKAKGLG